MKLGEVCLLTTQVIKMADFYRAVLRIDPAGCDIANATHQFIIAEETSLTIRNCGVDFTMYPHNFGIAFTVDDVDAECARLEGIGIEIISPPTDRPWGARNMSFADPDGNVVVFRSILEERDE